MLDDSVLSILRFFLTLQKATRSQEFVVVQALWKGVTPTMVRQGWNQLFLFGSYDLMKKSIFGLEREDPILGWQSTTIGLIAGALGEYPSNRVATRVLLNSLVVIAGHAPTIVPACSCLSS